MFRYGGFIKKAPLRYFFILIISKERAFNLPDSQARVRIFMWLNHLVFYGNTIFTLLERSERSESQNGQRGWSKAI